MKKIRIGLIVGAFIIIVADLILIDYSNLTWSKNVGAYCSILAMICLIISSLIHIKHYKKQQANSTDNSK